MNPPARRRPMESWVLLNPPPIQRRPKPVLELAPAVPPQRKLRFGEIILGSIAWTVVAALVAGVVWAQSTRGDLEKSAGSKERVKEALEIVQDQFAARYIIGMSALFGQGGEQGLKQLGELKKRSFLNELKFAVYAGELVGAKRALNELKQIKRNSKKSKTVIDGDNSKLLPILQRLYGDYDKQKFDAPSVTQDERKWLSDRLGWAGQLALVPAGGGEMERRDNFNRGDVLEPARRTFAITIVGMALLLGVGGLGLIGLFLCGVYCFDGRIRSGLRMQPRNGVVYIETFALWMILFALFSVLAQLVIQNIPFEAPPLLLSAVAVFLSLSALLWPVARGVSWNTFRQEVGLTFGKRPWLEILMGPACYAMTIPLAIIGLLLTYALMVAYKNWTISMGGDPTESAPAHPIVADMIQLDWWKVAQIFLVACVAAPIVEEIMFRGVLYRHLRGMTDRWGLLLSVLASSAMTSFVFAVIHPQGALALPALMSLAFGFTLAREWRRSLVPSIIAHGINNGVLMVMFFLIFSQ